MSRFNHHVPTPKEVLEHYSHLSDKEKAEHLAKIVNLLYIQEKKLLNINQLLVDNFKRLGIKTIYKQNISILSTSDGIVNDNLLS